MAPKSKSNAAIKTIEFEEYFPEITENGKRYAQNAATGALALLTHKDGVPYLEYVARLKDNPVARKVKLADLRHNSDLSRLDEVDEKAKSRLEKYKAAIELLEA